MHLFKHKKDKNPKPNDKDKSTERDRSPKRDHVESNGDDNHERMGEKVTSFMYRSSNTRNQDSPNQSTANLISAGRIKAQSRLRGLASVKISTTTMT
jgi:hypothetical protein